MACMRVFPWTHARCSVRLFLPRRRDLRAKWQQPQPRCTAAGGARCVYPDAYSGTWNASLTYGFPTLITLPHFYLVKPVSAC